MLLKKNTLLELCKCYTAQVFDDKHGFLNNLSVLDLLFNEGKFAMDYLKNQAIIK